MFLFSIPLLLLCLAQLTTSQKPTSTVTLSAPSTSPTSPSYTSDTTFRTSCLNSTNTFRAQHNATSLTWNNTLASSASTLTYRCQLKHSSTRNIGENTAAGYKNVTSTIDAWGNERREYDFGNEGGFDKDTGHFTQLVWKATRSVGCARRLCGELGWFVVCQYEPPGNVDGGYGEEVQKQVKGTGESGAMGRGVGGLWSVLGVVVVVGLWTEVVATVPMA